MKQFITEEKHINPTISDFDTFCSFIDKQRPKLSKSMELLGKNDLFSLNAKLIFQKDVSAPNFQQESYPFIKLMFSLSVLGGLYRKVGDDKANVYLEGTTRKAEFERLNPFEKYCFLLETFWTKFDFEELIRWGTDSSDQFTKTISKSKPGQELVKGSFSKRSDYEPLFSYLAVFVHYYSFFGFCLVKQLAVTNKKQGKYDDSISSIYPTEFGVNMCKILHKLNLKLWSSPFQSKFGFYFEDEEPDNKKGTFLEHLVSLFPDNSLNNSVKDETIENQKGNYTFKVMLNTAIWRKIKLSHKHTLEDLHLYIQKAFDFDNDHLYSFFMDGKKYSDDVYNSSFGDEPPFTYEAVIGELGLYKGKKILYLFDYGDSWEFQVQLLAIDENEKEIKKPKITESKGEAPSQYHYEEDDEDFDDE